MSATMQAGPENWKFFCDEYQGDQSEDGPTREPSDLEKEPNDSWIFHLGENWGKRRAQAAGSEAVESTKHEESPQKVSADVASTKVVPENWKLFCDEYQGDQSEDGPTREPSDSEKEPNDSWVFHLFQSTNWATVRSPLAHLNCASRTKKTSRRAVDSGVLSNSDTANNDACWMESKEHQESPKKIFDDHILKPHEDLVCHEV